MREKFKEWEDDEAQRKLAIKEKATKSKGQADVKAKNYAPYSFSDGEYLLREKFSLLNEFVSKS